MISPSWHFSPCSPAGHFRSHSPLARSHDPPPGHSHCCSQPGPKEPNSQSVKTWEKVKLRTNIRIKNCSTTKVTRDIKKHTEPVHLRCLERHLHQDSLLLMCRCDNSCPQITSLFQHNGDTGRKLSGEEGIRVSWRAYHSGTAGLCIRPCTNTSPSWDHTRWSAAGRSRIPWSRLRRGSTWDTLRAVNPGDGPGQTHTHAPPHMRTHACVVLRRRRVMLTLIKSVCVFNPGMG